MKGLRLAAEVGMVGLGQAAVGPLDGLGSGAGLQSQQPEGLAAAGIARGARPLTRPLSRP